MGQRGPTGSQIASRAGIGGGFHEALRREEAVASSKRSTAVVYAATFAAIWRDNPEAVWPFADH
jgi:hypothetical protein